MFVCLTLLPPPNPVSSPVPIERLLEVAREFSPRVEAWKGRSVLLDAGGLSRLFGDARALGDALRRTAADRGLVGTRVAVAATRVAALLLAHGRPALTVVPPGEEAAVLAPLPLGLLTVWARSTRLQPGPGPQSGPPHRKPDQAATDPLETLRRWGLKTLGDLAALPAADLSERLGQAGLVWQRAARGEDEGPLVPAVEPESFEAALALEWPVDRLEPLSFIVGRLCEDICAQLERAACGAVALQVQLRLTTREICTRVLGLPAPMRDPRILRTLVMLHLESNPPAAGVDGVTLVAEPAPERVLQYSLLTKPLPAPEQLSTLLARLGALMGDGRCGAAALVDSHRPGAFAIVPFQLAVGGASPASHRLSQGRLPPAVLRRFRVPIPARVALDHGQPIRVMTDRCDLAGGRIVRCAGPWRTSGEWWLPPSADRQAGWNCDEWDIGLSDGGLYRMFRNRDDDRWFIAGTID